ncbi:response regulator [Enterocloster lavalensis]|uniref:response regulator transcription factor n=1 Tax=Enterocloster lavalensis TaxID=460384 RepID=UPI0039844F85
MEGEMIRAVVADDEKIIREGIAEWVDWNKLGICLVGCAKNGEEALAAVREHQADLLVTDIRMPGISGLELAEQLEREEKPPLIILISGYSDFAYAQKAVKLKCVVDYVLKPLELEQLEAVLAKTGQQILKRRHSILVPPVERTEESAGTGARMAGMTARLVRFISAGEEKETAERLGELCETGHPAETVKALPPEQLLPFMERAVMGCVRLIGETRNRSCSALIKSALEEIDRNYYRSEFTLQTLEETLMVSPNYLSARFKEETGTGFVRCLNEKRMERAKGLLADVSRKIYEVACQCGIDDVRYFTRLFKEYAGMTPKEYRDKIL